MNEKARAAFANTLLQVALGSAKMWYVTEPNSLSSHVGLHGDIHVSKVALANLLSNLQTGRAPPQEWAGRVN